MILPPQVKVSPIKPDPQKMTGVADDMFWKPRGGLWTSTLDEHGGDWLRWITGEGYTLDMDKWGGKLWRLEPTEANVFIIATPEDLYELHEKYPYPVPPEMARLHSFSLLVHWQRVAEDYDAVHIPHPWGWRFYMGSPEDDESAKERAYAASMFFYVVDAESTCWFRWCFEGDPVELDPEPYLAQLAAGGDADD